MRLIALLILTITTSFAGIAAAQEPPARAGRIAFTEGTVALYQDPEAGWQKAYVNSPITSENSVWTDPRSRAEIRISGVVVRLDEATQLDFARVDDDEIDGYVVGGSVAVRVRHEESQPAYFATPHAAFRLGGAGRYRIDVDAERDETVFTVFTGSAFMRSGGGEIRIEAGRAIRVDGDNTFVRVGARSDAFDRWTLARDEKWVERRSLRYVSPYMTGYEDLDAYGQWAEEPDYGAVWFPARVASDWVPYRHGHWAQVRPWGWTWIADEPWGYAPYHYGRWVYVRDRWGWLPGQRVDRPVWAPALVAWVGGTNFSVRIGGAATPAVGWYPLAPWERYEPWYRTNATYVNRINVIVRDAPPRNWQGDRRGDRDGWRTYNRERAATIVRREQFIDRRPVQQARITDISREVLRQAPVASPNNIFTREDVTRRQRQGQAQLRTPGSPSPTRAPVTAGAPATPQAPSANPPPPSRRLEAGTNYRPNFQRERRNAAAPAPSPAPAAAQPGAPAGTNPLSRGPRPEAGAPAQQQPQAQQRQQQREQQEQQRAAREAQQQQERAAREAQQQQRQQQEQQQRQQQERQGADQRRAQERAAREAQQQQQQQQRQQQEQQQRQQQEQQRQQQEQQRQQQERQGADQRRAQERAAREAQQQQQQQQQQRQQQEQQQRQQQEQQQRQQQEQQRQQQERQGADQRRAQERAAREAQQQQQQQQRQQQEQQQRQQQEQQRAARDAQQAQQRQQQQQEQARQQQEQARQQAEQRRAQERAAREAQQQQQQQQRAQEQQQRQQQQQQQRQQPQAQPQPAQPLPQRAAPPQRDKEKEKDKDNKGNDEKDNPGKGRGRDR